MCDSGSDFPKYESTLHWRHVREYSGNNIMNMGIWYEAMMRWVGPAKSVMAVGQNVVRHRLDDSGRRVAMEIPDHIDVIGAMAQGGQMRFNVSSVLGHVPELADVLIAGTEGSIRLHQPVCGSLQLSAGKRGQAALEPVAIDPSKRGGWRVEEEFVQAIRGLEPVTHTSFEDGVKYMEFTEAVNVSLAEGCSVAL